MARINLLLNNSVQNAFFMVTPFMVGLGLMGIWVRAWSDCGHPISAARVPGQIARTSKGSGSCP
jgi:hypothetical protein